MKHGEPLSSAIKVIVSNGHQASFPTFNAAEKWLEENAKGLYACAWVARTKGRQFREYNTEAPI